MSLKSVQNFPALLLSTQHFPSLPPQPQNILLTSLSPPGDIKIVDFGLARRLGAVGELREILGTPEYVGKVMFITLESSQQDATSSTALKSARGQPENRLCAPQIISGLRLLRNPWL